MSKMKLVILICIALGLGAVAAFIYRDQTPIEGGAEGSGETLIGAPLAPEIEQGAQDVGRIEYVKADGERVAVERRDEDKWVISTLSDYPASPDKVSKFVYELVDLKIADRLTQKPELHEHFGLADDVGAKGTVRIENRQGEPMLELVVGKERESAGGDDFAMMSPGRYVRRGDDPAVYLIDNGFHWLETGFGTWADTNLFSVSPGDIVGLSVDHGSTESLTLEYAGGELQLTEVPEGMIVRDYEINTMRGALDALHVQGAQDAQSTLTQTLDTDWTGRAKYGTIYHARLGKVGEKAWVHFSAEYGEPLFTQADKASTETLAAAEKRADEAREEVAAFNERHEPWLYELSDWNYNKFVKERSELLEAEPEEAPAE